MVYLLSSFNTNGVFLFTTVGSDCRLFASELGIERVAQAVA